MVETAALLVEEVLHTAAITKGPSKTLSADLNDTHGHQYGDECLHKTAQAFAAALTRAGDFVARYGGEEFGLVLTDMDAVAAGRLKHCVPQSKSWRCLITARRSVNL